MLTDKDADYTNAALTATLGEGWRKLFDQVFVNAQKPLFQRAEAPFYVFDRAGKHGFRGKKIIIEKEMDDYTGSNYMIEGNALTLTHWV